MNTKVNTAIFIIFLMIFSCTAFAFAGTIQLSKTGQTTCYDTVGNEISCVGTGQDGEIQAGVAWPNPRFIDNGDGTVTDNLTGLMWTKDANLVDISFSSQITWQRAMDYLKTINTGGHTDWRLPNVNELRSLIDCSQDSPALPESNPFINVVTGQFYWASDVYTGDPNNAWVSSLGTAGLMDYVGMANITIYVWPVRAGQCGIDNSIICLPKTGQAVCYGYDDGEIPCVGTGQDGEIQAGVAWPNPRFIDNGDGTVTDNLTGLMWTKDANLSGDKMAWQNALDYVKTQNVGGHTDWRVPNITELRSLIDYSQYSPALPQSNPFINVISNYYWSSTTRAYPPSYALIVDMDDGLVGNSMSNDYKSSVNYVWPVRGGISGGSTTTSVSTSIYDIAISSDDIFITCNTAPYSANMITLNAAVHNNSQSDVQNVKVSFYKNDLTDANKLNADPIIVSTISTQGVAYAKYDVTIQPAEKNTWDNVKIIVKADPLQNETDVNDNTASKKFSINYADFNFPVDSYSFLNMSWDDAVFKSYLKNTLIKMGIFPAIQLLETFWMLAEKGGHCLGIAKTCILYMANKNLIPTQVETTYKLSEDQAIDNIRLAHMTQFISGLKSLIIAPSIISEYSGTKQLLSKNKPVLLSLGTKSGSVYPAWEPEHAVVGYKLVEELAEDSTIKNSFFYIYDSNFMYDEKNATFKNNGVNINSPIYLSFSEINSNNMSYKTGFYNSDLNSFQFINNNHYKAWNLMKAGYPASLISLSSFRSQSVSTFGTNDEQQAIMDVYNYEAQKLLENNKIVIALDSDCADFFITDDTGKRIGLVNGSVVNEIAGASINTYLNGGMVFLHLPGDNKYTVEAGGKCGGSFDQYLAIPQDNDNIRLINYEENKTSPGSISKTIVSKDTTEVTMNIDNNGDGKTDETKEPDTDNNFTPGALTTTTIFVNTTTTTSSSHTSTTSTTAIVSTSSTTPKITTTTTASRICPLKSILGTENSALCNLYSLRDTLLSRSSEGKVYINLYYKHAYELTDILSHNDGIKEKANSFMQKIMPTITSLLATKEGVLTDETVEEAIELIDALTIQASPALQQDLRELKQDIKSGVIFSIFNLKVGK
jgi:hypothetical protein